MDKNIQPIICENASFFSKNIRYLGIFIINCKKLNRMAKEKIEGEFEGGWSPPKDLEVEGAGCLESGKVVTPPPRKELEVKNSQEKMEK